MTLTERRIRECYAWIDGDRDSKAPHWRTQQMLRDKGYLSFSPTGWAMKTQTGMQLVASKEI
jgi:hypothetical protein